jgi:hypothetical protein
LLLRQEIGDVLRTHRQKQGATLRQVAAKASVALVLREVAERMASAEGLYFDDTFIPDTLPDDFVTEADLYSRQ